MIVLLMSDCRPGIRALMSDSKCWKFKHIFNKKKKKKIRTIINSAIWKQSVASQESMHPLNFNFQVTPSTRTTILHTLDSTFPRCTKPILEARCLHCLIFWNYKITFPVLSSWSKDNMKERLFPRKRKTLQQVNAYLSCVSTLVYKINLCQNSICPFPWKLIFFLCNFQVLCINFTFFFSFSSKNLFMGKFSDSKHWKLKICSQQSTCV